jgi:large subunit ribosomal protein L15
MDLSSLTNTPGARKDSVRKGRGRASGKGKTSGKGHKGQMARKGHKRKVAFEGGQMPLLRRLPKRGFTNPTRVEFTPVNLAILNRFEDGATVDPVALIRARIVKQVANGGVKILGVGTLERKLTVKASAFSASAKTKIEALGGSCETV